MRLFFRSILNFFGKFIIHLPGRLSVFVNSGKSFLQNVYAKIGVLGETILLKLYTFKFRYIIMAYVINFIVGRILALQGDFAGALVHQIVLTIISVIGLYMLQYMHRIVNNMYDAMADSSPEICVCLDRFNKARMSSLNLFFPVFPMVFAAKITLEMAFVPSSVMGYYDVFFYATAFYISLVCYGMLILSTKMIYELTKIEYTKLPFSYPDDLLEIPDWLKNLADIYRKAQFSFFTVGMLFTGEFVIMTSDYIEIIDSNGQFNKAVPFGFWITWIIIFVFIIIAFPIFWLMLKRLLVRLTLNFNKRALNELTNLNDNTEPADLTSVWSYYQLINHAVRFEKKIFPENNYYPLVATSVSFILNLYQVCELFKIPLWGGIMNSLVIGISLYF